MKSSVERRIRFGFWTLAILLGALQAWASRHAIDSDGISYLDHADAFFRGEWGQAFNAYWSPLYSWLLGLGLFLLKPTPYWEYTLVHLINFLIYLGALGAFEFFLRELIRYHELRQARLTRKGFIAFPPWAWQVLGYSQFIWSSLILISIREVTPDILVSAFVYLAMGILLRIQRKKAAWPAYIFLGWILALGYLAKTPMFMMSIVFLALSFFSSDKLTKAFPQTLVALIVFGFISAPFIFFISRTMGRPTIGESAKWHYYWFINHTVEPPFYPHVNKIFSDPPIYEFRTPIQGTYPLWFDPAYWSRDLTPHFDFKGMIKILMLSGKRYYAIFFLNQSYFIVCFLILLYMGRRRWLSIKDILENWILIIPAVTALGMYALTPVFTRYIGPFVVLFWLGLFSGIRLPDSEESKRLLAGVMLILITLMGVQVAREEIPLARITIKPSSHESWLVARSLKQVGIQPGDEVASIGNYSHAFWARLARVRIIAEIPYTSSARFWSSGPRVQSQAIKTFESTGAKVLVAERVPPDASTRGWKRIEDTDFFFRLLKA